MADCQADLNDEGTHRYWHAVFTAAPAGHGHPVPSAKLEKKNRADLTVWRGGKISQNIYRCMASSRQDKEVDGPWDSEEEGEIICEAHIKRQIKSDAEQPIVSPKF